MQLAMRQGRAKLSGAVSRVQVRTLRPADPTLAAVVAALVGPADEEQRWASAVETARARLEASEAILRYPLENRAWWERAVAASSDPRPPVLREDHIERTVGEVARVTSKPPAWGRFLFRIVRRLRPERCLELGTSVGMSGSYLGAALAANGAGRLVTIEGAEASATVARDVFADVGVSDRVEVHVGTFDDRMPSALSALGGVDVAFIDGHHQHDPTMRYFETILGATAAEGLLLFDDITYGLGDMARAWREIRAHRRVTGALTVGNVGCAVIDGRPARHRRVRQLTV